MRYANFWVEIFNMSEKEKSSEKPGFFINIDTENKIYCTPTNSVAYLHEDPQYDHLFYKIDENEDGNERGFYFFRSFVGDNFDLMIKYMIINGYAVENNIDVSSTDYQV